MTRSIIQGLIIPAGHGAAVEVKQGQVLRIYQVEGKQVADCAFFNAHDYREVFHVGQTWILNVDLGTGTAKQFKHLYSKPPRENVMFTVLEDTVGAHWGNCGLHAVGLFASISGHYEIAATFFADGNAMDRETNDSKNLGVGLRNQAELSVFLGRLSDSVDDATEALDLGLELQDKRQLLNSYAYRGWAGALSGQVGAGAQDFAIANALEKKNDPEGAELYSSGGVWWVEILLRTGHPDLAARRTTANLRICEREGWNEDVAGCHRMLADCALVQGRLDEAEAQLRQAEPVFQRGQLLFELAQVHVTSGRVALARRDTANGIRRSAEALALAQPRGMRLIHADALVLRGRARLLEDTLPDGERAGAGESNDSLLRALDDAEEGLRIARDCGYAWAERDALFLQAEVHTTLSLTYRAADNEFAGTHHRDNADRALQEAEALASRLHLTEDDLAQADAKAARWLEQWEKKTTVNP